MSSNGLEGRILAPLAGRPLLAQLSARIDRARIEDWWLITSSDPADDVTEAWGFELGLRVFRGDGSNVLAHYLAVASEARAEWILRVRADHPFLDAHLLDHLLDARDSTDETKRADVLRLHEGLPLGYDVELLRLRALNRAHGALSEKAPRTRPPLASGSSIRTAIARAPTTYVPIPHDWPTRPDWRWTVDTYQDLAMARSAFRVFGQAATTIDYPSMVACLDAHPEITGMNRHDSGGGQTAW